MKIVHTISEQLERPENNFNVVHIGFGQQISLVTLKTGAVLSFKMRLCEHIKKK